MVQVWFTLGQQPEPHLTLPGSALPHHTQLTSASFCFLRGMTQKSPRVSPVKVVDPGPAHPLLQPPSPAPASEPTPSLSLVSLEFDKFLEERAKVADQLPNLSSPSAEGPPGPPPGTVPRKKTQEKDDDMLFAL